MWCRGCRHSSRLPASCVTFSCTLSSLACLYYIVMLNSDIYSCEALPLSCCFSSAMDPSIYVGLQQWLGAERAGGFCIYLSALLNALHSIHEMQKIKVYMTFNMRDYPSQESFKFQPADFHTKMTLIETMLCLGNG